MFAGLTFYASERNLAGLYQGYQAGEMQLVELDVRIAELEQEKVRLERKIVGLDTDPLIVEVAIRKNTGHIRKGETIFRIEMPFAK
mgnify:CR=1 FL=1